jgi:DNA-binding transcriptional MerR regulator
MFSIGEFARHGRVSVRMLRHYDAIGLLRPDPDQWVTELQQPIRVDRG